jgi:hypothetical protein
MYDMRTYGSTVPNKLRRQDFVLTYFMHGAKTGEIAKALHVTERTIQLDLAVLKPWIYAKVEAEQLHSLRRSFLQKEEIWREIWSMYHRPLQDGKESPDTSRKLKALELATKMSAELDRIAGIGQSKEAAVVVKQEVHVGQTAAENAVEKLSEEEQLVLAKVIRDIESSEVDAGP